MSWCNLEGILTPPDRIRLKNDDIWIEGPIDLFLVWWGVGIVGLLKRAVQGGERRGAGYRWPYMRTGGEGDWTMVKEDLMRI